MHAKTRFALVLASLLIGCGGTDMETFEVEKDASDGGNYAQRKPCNPEGIHLQGGCLGDPGGPPPPPPASTLALTDVLICRGSQCPAVTPTGYTLQGQSAPYGTAYKLYQRYESVLEGEGLISDLRVTSTSHFLASPTPPSSGFEWLGSACEFVNGSHYYDCFNLFARYEEFQDALPMTKVINSRYCVADFWNNPWCQNAPAAIDPPSMIYRPTGAGGPPGGDPLCIFSLFSGADICHDLFIEKKQL